MIRKIQCFVMALCLLLTAAFGLGVPMTVSAAETDDFEIMYERCYEQTIGAKPGEALDTSNEYVAAFVQNVDKTANENWAIMNKSDDTDRTEIFQGIKPEVGVRPNTATADLTTTFTYLNNLAKAYVTPGTTLYQNEQVPEEIFSAVDFALDNDWYGSTTYNPYGNWWDHQIGVPAQLLPTMVVLRDKISDERFERYMTAMKNQRADNWDGWEAANQADISLNALYIGILEKDGDLLNKVKEGLGSEMFSYSTGNGWHEDGSYVDHDVFAYTGGYGSVLITAMEKMMPLVAGTEFELTYGDERDTFYDDIIFNNYVPTHYAGRIFDMVSGRSITRVTTQDRQSAGQLAVFADALSPEKGAQLRSIVKQWLLDDPDIMGKITKPAELSACIKILADDSIEPEGIPQGFYRFSDMDKYVQHNEDYSVGLSLHSNKIVNYEFLNEEGRKMWNTSDGALYINNADVDQYKDNFWPTVNHLRMPGVTTLFDGNRSDSAGHDTHNPNAWVGGVDMGDIGTAAMQIKTLGTGNARDGLLAKKSYFMFDDEVVAVGSDIQALTDTGLPAETVVENRKIKEDLSNKLTFNGEEVDVVDNSEQETVSKDQYVKIYTDPTAAGDCHNITHALPEDAKTVSFSTKMRFNDSWRNAGLRIMGTDAEGNAEKLFEVAMFTNQEAFLRTFNEGEPADGTKLFSIPARTDWWTLDASADLETHELTVKVTDAKGSVLAETTTQANLDVTAITSFDLFNTSGYINEFNFKTLKITADGNDVVDLDFNETTAEEWMADDAWAFQCVDADGNVKEEECSSHSLYSVTTVSNVTKTQLRKGTEVKDVSWAHLEGNVEGSDIGYYFPETTDLLAVKNERTGTWKELNDLKNWGHDDLPAYTRGYAEIVIDHGVLTTDGEHASYSYVLLPGKSEEETKAYNDNPDIEVLANNEAVHAVRENSLGVTALNFWTSKPAEAGGITANRFASVMWKDTGDTYELVVCDPTHNGTDPITLSIADAKIASVISKDDKITVNSEPGADTLELTVDVTGTERSQQYTAVFEKAEKETPEELSTAILEYALELAEKASTEGVVDAAVEKFEAAKADAQAVLDAVKAGDTSVTQKQIDDSWRALIKSMHYLSFQQGNKTDLGKVIVLAEEMEADLDSYLDEGKQAFIDALEGARAVYEDGNAMQDEVDQTWKALLKTMSELRKKAEKDALEDLISEVSGIDLTAYTEESAQAFRAALADAQAVLDDESLTEEDQETVNHAAEQLAAARDALLVKDDSAAPENPDQNGGESSQQGAGTVNNSGNGTDGKEAQNSAAGQKAVKTGDGSAPFAGTAAVMLLAAAAGAAAYRYRREKQ